MRPCFLVLDPEYPGSISIRKLVIETEKINVLTAYSAADAIETFTRFPAANGIVMNASVNDPPCTELIKRLRAIRNDVSIILISPSGLESCEGENYRISSFDPKALLDMIQKICAPEVDQIIQHDEDLARIESKNPR